MASILDQFRSVQRTFKPGTIREAFALRLATKLGEANTVEHYRQLTESYSESHLLWAYKRLSRSSSVVEMGKGFHHELAKPYANGHGGSTTGLIAIRVERRTVAATIFQGTHLEYSDSRQLSSVHDKAIGSAIGFANWILDHFSVESSALESIPDGQDFQRRQLNIAVQEVLRSRMLPIWEISRTDLLQGFGIPSLKSRAELREISKSIWPILAGTNAKLFMQDAAALGLHVQLERSFLN